MSEKNEWKPIESAPKDGTPVLLFARHIDAEASTRVVGSFDGNENGLGWHAQCYVGQPFARLDPSHWMELPPFPGSPAPSAPGDAQDERQAFEAWAEDQGFVLDCDFFEVSGQYYDSDDTQLAYDIWRAARASVAAPAAGDALDAARYRWLREGDTDLLIPFHVDGCLPSGDQFDAAVDAVIAAQVPQQGEA